MELTKKYRIIWNKKTKVLLEKFSYDTEYLQGRVIFTNELLDGFEANTLEEIETFMEENELIQVL